MWTALVNEYRLQYINPPPAYSTKTQRLRTPSEIVGSNSGTCIDLALLLASCLEYIGIYPVLVLLTGHAFVGYWRSDTVHDEDFATVKTSAGDGTGRGRQDRARCRVALCRPIWMASDHAELRRGHGLRDVGRSRHAGGHFPDRRQAASATPRRRAGRTCAAGKSSTACSTSSSPAPHHRRSPLFRSSTRDGIEHGPTTHIRRSHKVSVATCSPGRSQGHLQGPLRGIQQRRRNSRRAAAPPAPGGQYAGESDQDRLAGGRGRRSVLARRHPGKRLLNDASQAPQAPVCPADPGRHSGAGQDSFRCWPRTR